LDAAEGEEKEIMTLRGSSRAKTRHHFARSERGLGSGSDFRHMRLCFHQFEGAANPRKTRASEWRRFYRKERGIKRR